MKKQSLSQFFIGSIFFIIAASSCNFKVDDGSRGPIVLGDAKTIVTETDSQYLDDIVLDVNEETIAAPISKDKDEFKNVATAAQLAKQQELDSIAAAKVSADQAADAAKKKEEEKKKQAEKKKASTKKPVSKTTAKATTSKKTSKASTKPVQKTSTTKKKTRR